jgi:hypothetical protein
VGGYLHELGAFFALVGGGGLAVFWRYRRSLGKLDYVDDGYAVPASEATPAAEARVRTQAQPEVAELQALARKIESGQEVTPAEHARIAQLVGELGTIEQRPR